MSLRFKIAESLPRDSVSLRALLSIASVEETKEVQTACVTFGQHPRLLVNPSFVSQHAGTPVKLQTLIGHELLHVALGHTRRYTACSPLDNLVFDCLINSILSKTDPTPERTSLFRDFYSEDRFPECFLRPPENWHPSARVRLPHALQSSRIDGLPFVQDVYRRLWGDAGASGSEVRAAILLGAARLNTSLLDAIDQIPLLGGHADHVEEPLSGEELTAYVTGLVVQEINNKLVKRGIHHDAAFLLPQKLDHVAPASLNIRRQLRGLFEHLAHGTGSAKLKSGHPRLQTHITAVPHRDRQAIVQRLLGNQPMLYRATDVRPNIRSSGRIHVYLDVSGSMNNVIPALYGAMRDCQDWIHDKVHLFSTVVADISRTQLKAGMRITTQGTNINCVADHLDKHNVKRALIITDGFVGKPSAKAAKVLTETKLVAALAGSSVWMNDLAPFIKRHERLLDVS